MIHLKVKKLYTPTDLPIERWGFVASTLALSSIKLIPKLRT